MNSGSTKQVAAVRDVVTSCRICAGQCALRMTQDATGRILSVRGDPDNPVTRGFACIKGLTLHEAHVSPDRLLRPMKRQPNGSFAPIPLDRALDEIAEQIAAIAARHGPHAIAAFRGTLAYGNVLANVMMTQWLQAIGSRSLFSTMTIDQSAKWINVERLGAWAAGRTPMREADVLMMVGTNPLVSLSTFNFINQNPVKSIKEAKAAGLRIIVIDPRESETAKFADVHLRPLPGEDATLVAGMLNAILANGWEDRDFCGRFVAGMDPLRAALAPFTLDTVAQRTGVPAADMMAAVRLFAEPLPDRAKRGNAASGTGANMGFRSNLAEHLIECLNVLCGRYPRAGDRVANPGVVAARYPRLEQVVPPGRRWESGWRDSNGFGMIFGERMSATLPDAIRSRGEDRVAALIVDGGNPVNAMPGTDTAAAFAGLELLVSIDPFLTATSRMAHYILPPTMMYERYDIMSPVYEPHVIQMPYTQFSRPVLTQPADSELIGDWRVFWELGRRLGAPMTFGDALVDYDQDPDDMALLAALIRHSAVPFEEIAASDEGRLFDVPPQYVEPGQSDARFAVAPGDIVAELGDLVQEVSAPDAQRPFRFAVRRMREVQNSMYHQLPSIRRRVPGNPAWLHPDDIVALGLRDGDSVLIESAHGAITAPVRSDATMRRGVVAMAHGWGDDGVGANVNVLTSRTVDRDPINAMPVMTGFSVSIRGI